MSHRQARTDRAVRLQGRKYYLRYTLCSALKREVEILLPALASEAQTLQACIAGDTFAVAQTSWCLAILYGI